MSASHILGAPEDSSDPRQRLSRLMLRKRVVLCVGSGGVGKTTTAAALALAGARAGRTVLCLTIDPARRLAQSLGLESMTGDEIDVSAAVFAAAGLVVAGSLRVMMLDTKRTFDDIVHRHASSESARDAILGNKIYRYVSTSLAGMQEYMAMEKLQALRDADRYDLIVLDTPPTANALDFLDAPERMIEAIDSPAMRWFLQAFSGAGGAARGRGLVGRGSQLMMRAVSRIIGAGFLDELAGFIAAVNDLFGGFSDRARRVALALRSPEAAFVLVTSPEPMAIAEVNHFSSRLRTLSMPRDAFIVNRVHMPPGDAVDPSRLRGALREAKLPDDDSFVARVESARREAQLLAQYDAEHLEGLVLDDPTAPVVRVPAFEGDVHDVAALARVADALVGPVTTGP